MKEFSLIFLSKSVLRKELVRKRDLFLFSSFLSYLYILPVCNKMVKIELTLNLHRIHSLNIAERQLLYY